MVSNKLFIGSLLLVLAISTSSFAQSTRSFSQEDPEAFKIEVTGSAWLLNSGGQIQANGTPVDFRTDLGVSQQQPTFYGQLVIKPGRKHRIIVEGTPFSIHGQNTVNRTLVYHGQTFSVSDNVSSSATLNYVFAGYQFDVLSGRRGHLGFSVGGAYLAATGTLQSTIALSRSGSKSETIGLPLAGVDFRLFPIAGHRILEIEGGVRGMTFGSYGYYIEATGSGGVCVGPVCLLAGYRDVNTEFYSGGSGITARLGGPIFSGVFRW